MRIGWDILTERWERLPMLKLLIPFVGGVLLGESFGLPLWVVWFTLAGAGLGALLLRSQVLLAMLCLVAGLAAVELRPPRHLTPEGVTTLFEIGIEGIPVEGGKGMKGEGVILGWRDPGTGRWYPSGEGVLFSTDSLTRVGAGERILCRTKLRPFGRDPRWIGYHRLMERRGFVGRIWISERGIFSREQPPGRSLHEWAVERMRRLEIGGEEEAVLLSMVTGERGGLNREIRDRYARSGMAHLLAVSGLHVGIVLMIVNILLGWMSLLTHGHRWRAVICIGVVWGFVAVTGFPPSAIRAGVMCTILQAAWASGEEYGALNAWAATALVMLVWNAGWIGDIGFQLSFVSVAAILVWGVPLLRRLRTRWWWVNVMVDSVVISVVVGVGTAPLVIRAFGFAPLAGVVLNPVAIILGGVLLLVGIVWMILPVELWSGVAGWLVRRSAEGLDLLAEAGSRMPRVEAGEAVGEWAVIGIYLGFVALTMLLAAVRRERGPRLGRM